MLTSTTMQTIESKKINIWTLENWRITVILTILISKKIITLLLILKSKER